MAELVMVYDTETSDKWNFQAAWNASDQPFLVQLGYKVYEPRTREVIFEIGHLVDSTRLNGWKGINPEAQAVHGIDASLLPIYGIDPEKAIGGFTKWAERCRLFVAHNEDFDNKIMMCAAARAGYSPTVFDSGQKYCTMKSSTNICRIPHPKTGAPKWPKLSEAYPFFMDGQQFKGAHNALADVNACGDIFWAHVDRGIYALGL